MICSWPSGCSYPAGEDRLCYYHSKVFGGFIETTRGEGTLAIVPVAMRPEDRERARRARQHYFEGLLDRIA